MSIQDFVKQFNNSSLEVIDGKNRNQCFDLVVGWTDWMGIPRQANGRSVFPFSYAYQIYSNFGELQAKYFDRIANGPLNTPQAGDIMVWKSGYNGGAGHTAVVVNAGILTFNAFSQNDPTGSRCIVKNYSYGYLSGRGVYGWLRLKKKELTSDEKIAEIKKKINSSIGDSDYRNWERRFLGV